MPPEAEPVPPAPPLLRRRSRAGARAAAARGRSAGAGAGRRRSSRRCRRPSRRSRWPASATANAFLRSPDNDFIFFPNGRLQVDSYLFPTRGDKNKAKIPNNTFLLRRARLELGGWIGSFVYFWLAGDFALGPPAAAAPVAPANLATTDDFVALAPWKNLAILQVGQFDAPFTLENRTSDKYFDFMERSITVRAFGIPDNKEMGAMLHGFNDDRNYYYSVAVLNGDGQNFKNVDRAVRL